MVLLGVSRYEESQLNSFRKINEDILHTLDLVGKLKIAVIIGYSLYNYFIGEGSIITNAFFHSDMDYI